MSKSHEQLIIQLTRGNYKTRRDFDIAKRKACKKLGLAIPTSVELLKVYNKLVKNKRIKENTLLQSLLKKREVRTLSGVAPIAVLTKPYPCPGNCAYCPHEKNVPQSYLSNEPAVMRAILSKYDPFRQVQARLRALTENGHATDKCELIVMGGTWSYLPKKYQTNYIKRCFDAFNGKTAKNLTEAQKWNENAHHRCVGMTLETRPDYVTEAEVKRWRELGATRVEMGVQHIDDKILKLNKRGHDTARTIGATRLFRQAGFKITYHLMPGLPGSTPAKDLKMFLELFSNPDFQPDQIKIYPCVVVKGSLLYRWWQAGKYKPYTDKQLYNLLKQIKNIVPPYIRITRLIRDIPAESIEAGNKVSNLRQLLQEDPEVECKCIRCREVRKSRFKIQDLRFKIKKYKADGGTEYFLSYEDIKNKKLLAFLRLRVPSKGEKNFIPEIQDATMIREVHTYGQMVPVGRSSKSVQHLGWGKKLMAQAEKISKKSGFNKIAVISGIGVRKYYQKQDYKLADTYLVKNLKG